MKPRQIEQFLAIFARELGMPARAYVTGACAAAFWGRVRPSLDVDFGLELPGGRPADWTRVADVREVFKRQQIDATAAARFWGRARRASPPSSAQFQFRRNVERFFEVEGRAVWGRSWVAEPAIAQFRRAARIR